MFAAVFFGMQWLLTVQPLQPDARLPTFQRVDKDSPRFQLEQTSISDNDPTRDRLRHEVLDDAKALNDDPCNDVLKRRYIKAVNDYARAWISIVPCLGARTAVHRIRRSWNAPPTHSARRSIIACAKRCRKSMPRRRSSSAIFPNDTAVLVGRSLAADGSINPLADTGGSSSVRAQLGDDDTHQDCGH